MNLVLVFSHSDLSMKAVGFEATFPFFFGSPITVNPAPFGRLRFLMGGGIFTMEMLSMADNGFRPFDAPIMRFVYIPVFNY